jgi:SAM-dependent methyltransferase
MLRYSQQWVAAGVHLAVGNAFELPLASESIQLLVSSLGDPYNAALFWEEGRRVLRPGGILVFTTPSYDWASRFRADGDMGVAEFELADGRRVDVPSWIYPREEQIRIFARHGLSTEQLAEVPISRLNGSPLSPKLVQRSGLNASVVTGYRLAKT